MNKKHTFISVQIFDKFKVLLWVELTFNIYTDCQYD